MENDEMLRELNVAIAYAQVAYASSRTVEETNYWKGYNDAINELTDIVRR